MKKKAEVTPRLFSFGGGKANEYGENSDYRFDTHTSSDYRFDTLKNALKSKSKTLKQKDKALKQLRFKALSW